MQTLVASHLRLGGTHDVPIVDLQRKCLTAAEAKAHTGGTHPLVRDLSFESLIAPKTRAIEECKRMTLSRRMQQ